MKKLVLVFAIVATASLVTSCARRQARIEAEQEAIASEEQSPAAGEAAIVNVVEGTAEGVVGDSLITDTVVGISVTPVE